MKPVPQPFTHRINAVPTVGSTIEFRDDEGRLTKQWTEEASA